ncbi:hypothetical protein OUZ56_016473 [Daphnia magna]|uniref:Uncharacterized protein n=1 Tax=Daphnia magna TaxID=35525 RepID=A0ABR0AQM4_9CRUS|nr:hypothetical protein OUZ56_016473 [Daphnia magna]
MCAEPPANLTDFIVEIQRLEQIIGVEQQSKLDGWGVLNVDSSGKVSSTETAVGICLALRYAVTLVIWKDIWLDTAQTYRILTNAQRRRETRRLAHLGRVGKISLTSGPHSTSISHTVIKE